MIGGGGLMEWSQVEKLRAHEDIGKASRVRLSVSLSLSFPISSPSQKYLWRYGDAYDSDDEGPEPQSVFGDAPIPYPAAKTDRSAGKAAARGGPRASAWGAAGKR
jgi:hypothetical protein